MSGAIMNKIWGAFGMDAAEEQDDEELDFEEGYEGEEEEKVKQPLWGR